MFAKIEKKSDKIGTFGGIFQTINFFRHLGLSELIDNTLKNRRFNAKYRPSEIVEELLANYCSGGTCIEDANTFRTDTYTRGGYRFSSPDTIHKLFRENEVPDTVVVSDSGHKYNFNINARLGDLLTALLRNFMVLFKQLIARYFGSNIAETSRMKRVVRNFMTVPFKWVVKGGQMWLRLYTDKPYDCLRL